MCLSGVAGARAPSSLPPKTLKLPSEIAPCNLLAQGRGGPARRSKSPGGGLGGSGSCPSTTRRRLCRWGARGASPCPRAATSPGRNHPHKERGEGGTAGAWVLPQLREGFVAVAGHGQGSGSWIGYREGSVVRRVGILQATASCVAEGQLRPQPHRFIDQFSANEERHRGRRWRSHCVHWHYRHPAGEWPCSAPRGSAQPRRVPDPAALLPTAPAQRGSQLLHDSSDLFSLK